MLDREKFPIGYVCAEVPPLTSSITSLDNEENNGNFYQPPRDGNTYTFGTIG
ncbi:hypothetical protein BFJ63_vAg14401 [Fusarium oxysporum f. sp. narcissi]|uniref:Uncharacterized protein n=1 Tax=Fusarium oxysporum f. sp. narcissi TaxID=451672 RepID=A0A4Q2V694_FUSOX|nr:hypothetical protein BFJ63_vAg14401 [Fusarium oxysporum f. sp. narcissi]